MPTHEGNKKLANILIAVILGTILLGGYMAKEIRKEERKAEATELVRWHNETTWGLHQRRQNCSAAAAEPCCWGNVAMEQNIADLQFELECRRKNILSFCRAEEAELSASLPR